MKDGFIKVAAVTPDIEVGNTAYNTEQIIQCMEHAETECAKVLVFPELCIPGYTCNDLLQHISAHFAKMIFRFISSWPGTRERIRAYL